MAPKGDPFWSHVAYCVLSLFFPGRCWSICCCCFLLIVIDLFFWGVGSFSSLERLGGEKWVSIVRQVTGGVDFWSLIEGLRDYRDEEGRLEERSGVKNLRLSNSLGREFLSPRLMLDPWWGAEELRKKARTSTWEKFLKRHLSDAISQMSPFKCHLPDLTFEVQR